MKKTKLELFYNPYTLTTELIVNGLVVSDGILDYCINKRLQQWIDQFLLMIQKYYRSSHIELVFKGTVVDAEDVKDAVCNYNHLDKAVPIQLESVIVPVSVKNRTRKLKELYDKALSGPFEEFSSPVMKYNFESALNTEFEVTVVATMSSGKSTIINSMLEKEICPTKNQACTSTIAKIHDKDGMQGVKASRYDVHQQLIDDWQECDLKKMQEWNRDEKTSLIEIECDIKAINEQEDVRIVLIDTPGPNNSRNAMHYNTTVNAIREKNMSMVLYVLNSTQLSTNDDANFLGTIREAMEAGGRDAQDRFIFLANRIDCIDPEREETVGSTLDYVRKYLEKNGIKNPFIVPTSAEATRLIRKKRSLGQDSLTRSERHNLYKFVDMFVEEEDLNLLEHTKNHLSSSIYNKIYDQIEKAKDDGDRERQAELLSGIPIVEAILDNYILKHAIPAKIKDAVDSFSIVINTAKGIERLNALIQSDTESISTINTGISKMLEDKKLVAKADEFREEIKSKKFVISTATKKKVHVVDLKMKNLLDTTGMYFEKNVSVDRAKSLFAKAERECHYCFAEIERIYEESMNDEFLFKIQHLRDEYNKHVKGILEATFPSDEEFDIQELHFANMAMPNASSFARRNSYVKRTKVFVRKERYGFLWLRKRDVFRTDTEKLVNMAKAWQSLEADLRSHKIKLNMEWKKKTKENHHAAKMLLIEVMDEIEEKITSLNDNLGRASANKIVKSNLIKENNSKLEWYSNFKKELDKIVAI